MVDQNYAHQIGSFPSRIRVNMKKIETTTELYNIFRACWMPVFFFAVLRSSFTNLWKTSRNSTATILRFQPCGSTKKGENPPWECRNGWFPTSAPSISAWDFDREGSSKDWIPSTLGDSPWASGNIWGYVNLRDTISFNKYQRQY